MATSRVPRKTTLWNLSATPCLNTHGCAHAVQVVARDSRLKSDTSLHDSSAVIPQPTLHEQRQRFTLTPKGRAGHEQSRQRSRTPDHTVCEIVRAFDHQGWKDSSRDDLTSCELHGPPRALGAECRPLFAPCDAEGRQNISCLEYVQPCARLCTFTSQLLSPVMWSGWVGLLSDPCAVVPQKLEREHAAELVSVPVRSCGSTVSSHVKHVDERRLRFETEWQKTDDHILCSPTT